MVKDDGGAEPPPGTSKTRPRTRIPARASQARLACPAHGFSPYRTLRPPLSVRYTQAMGILRRLSRWMGNQDHMTHIVAGYRAPGFSLKSLDNKDYSLAALLERGPVVAAFFKISCPVCQF